MQLVPIQTVTGQTKQMSKWIKSFIRQNINDCSITLDTYGNIYVTRGKAKLYPTMVCHIDTVHEILPNVNAFLTGSSEKVNGNIIYAIDMDKGQQVGTGGDDKVGIAITIMMLNYFKEFKAVFFLDEESGCTGSSQCNASFFDDSTIVLQCDRRGHTDFVNKISNTKLYGKSLKKIISPLLKQYKRKEVTGGITDVGAIAKQNKVMVANMSCGYYDPHMDNETIQIDKVVETYELCQSIFKLTVLKRYEFNKIDDRISSYGLGHYYGGYHNHNHWNREVTDYNRSFFRDEELDKEDNNEEYPETIDIGEHIECPCCDAHEYNSYLEYDFNMDMYWCYNCNDYINWNKVEEYNLELNSSTNENKSNKDDDGQRAFSFTD
tara:strand:- start:659 stop:1792 length:1134 start_codon:yes stop_codon:yes gene_type:complete